MDYDQLAFDLERSASVRLLRSDHAPLVLAFLHRHFKQAQRIAVPYHELVGQLESYLEGLNERLEQPYPRSAQAYLKLWSDDAHGWLRVYTRGTSDEPVAELSADCEQALSWAAELDRRSFIGTESRFLQIFALLDEIVSRGTDDVAARLDQLARQRDALQREIDTIQATGEAGRYSATQLRERFLHASEVARQLLRDFAAVEQNFRSIARTVQEAQLRPEARKGAVLGVVLDADAQLKASDEGRSFYAFWEFLMSPAKQEQLHELLDKAYRIPELEELGRDSRLLRHLSRTLLEAGERIVQSNHRLAEQLRRMLDERQIAERRRVRELLAEIKQVAFRLADHPPDDEAFFELEGLPEAQLMMEKALWEPTTPVVFSAQPLTVGSTPVDSAAFARLYSQFVIDETRLRRQVDALLEQRPQLTLAEVVARHPVEQGLPEVIAYLTVASRDPRHTIDRAQTEQIPLAHAGDALPPAALTVPLITFRRSHAR